MAEPDLRLVGDKDALDVQLDAMAAFRIEQIIRLHARREQQAGIFQLAFGAPMDGESRVIIGMRHVMIKFLVLFGGDLIFGAQPQSAPRLAGLSSSLRIIGIAM